MSVRAISRALSSAPALLTLLGAIIAAVGVFWASRRTAFSQAQLIALNQQLAEKNDEIAKLSERIADSITGGKAFPHIQLMLQEFPCPRVVLVNNGDMSLYDLSVRMVDLDRFDVLLKNKMKPTFDEIRSCDTLFQLGTLAGHKASIRPVGLITFPSSAENIRLNIFFSARNGDTVELYRAKKVAGEWKTAVQVRRDDEKIYEQIDSPYFIVNPEGQLE